MCKQDLSLNNLQVLVWSGGISTIVGYVMPNPVFTYMLNMWYVNRFCSYTQLNDQTIQFSISQQS